MVSKKTAHASEQERPDVAAERRAWLAAQPDLDARHPVFIVILKHLQTGTFVSQGASSKFFL